MEFFRNLDPNTTLNTLLATGLYILTVILIWRTTKLQPIVMYMNNVQDDDTDEVEFDTLDTAGDVAETGNECIWCGKEYPKPIDDVNPESAWYEAQKNWIMLSYGSGDVTKVACCVSHMEQYIMCGK